jgi:hypothetical protein
MIAETAAVRDKGRRKVPTPEALQLAASASRRVSDRDAPLSADFVRSTGAGRPPLARFLRGGRGGEVRLKLYLTAIWIAARPPHETAFPARAWAELLDLPDPDGSGARRIADAIHWLERNRFVRLERRRGYPSVVFLLDEAGSGEPYAHPVKRSRRYMQIPREIWTNGWMSVLSAAAVALLLILLDMRDFSEAERYVWISPRMAAERYSISPDTWSRALAELRLFALVNVRKLPVSENAFEWRRVRNSYNVSMESIRGSAPSTLPA